MQNNNAAREPIRCGWAKGEQYIRYHDQEWGVPVHDDRTLFEFLILEGAQAGLSWSTILNKRENYRRAFEGFDPRHIARYQAKKIRSLLADPGIVRNTSEKASRSNSRLGGDCESQVKKNARTWHGAYISMSYCPKIDRSVLGGPKGSVQSDRCGDVSMFGLSINSPFDSPLAVPTARTASSGATVHGTPCIPVKARNDSEAALVSQPT